MRSTLNCKVEQTVIVEKKGQCVYKLTAHKCVHPPNDVEIEMEISKLKNGKATGCDKIVAKFIKEG
jgi:homospermidine synthase